MNKLIQTIKNFIPNVIKTITLIIKALTFSKETLETIEKNLKDIKDIKKGK